MPRALTKQVLQNVLLNSKRRCCLCFVSGNHELQPGVIAHLNRGSQKNTEDNIVFLCANHHAQFDKGEFQIDEVKKARTKLYRAMGQHLEDEAELKQPWHKFEEQVQAILVEELKDSMGDKANIYCNRIYKGRSGYSREVDIAVELILTGFKLLIAIEIKYAKRNISIPDIEAFTAKIEDMGANKGVLVSNSGFSESAVRFAKAHGIALIQLKEDADLTQVNTFADFLTVE